MANNTVSVVIPTYKRTTTLKRAIDSVLAQTYKDIEIIVVDDNSEFKDIREENRKLIKSYNNKKILFIENQKNLGGGLSRNEGIKKASGDYIAFLDDDDEFLPQKIEKQLSFYKKNKNNNIAMVYCFAEMINVNGSSYIYNREINGNNIISHVNNCIAATSWWLCPKEKLLEVGCFEDISSRQDASLLLKFLLKGYEFYCIPEILLKYYWHDSNSGISKTNCKSVEAEKQYRNIFIANSESLTKNEIDNMIRILKTEYNKAYKETH